MPQLRSVHVGGIDLTNERVYIAVKGTRQELMYELNCWLFDYFYAHGMEIKQLPPLDDWHHSIEDQTFYSTNFPDPIWNIWIRAEPIEFK